MRPEGDSAAISCRTDGRQWSATAALAVLADGGTLARSAASHKQRDYAQSSVVADVIADRPNARRAYERFTPTGPIALLPAGEGFALVWTTTPIRRCTSPPWTMRHSCTRCRRPSALAPVASRGARRGPRIRSRCAWPSHATRARRAAGQRRPSPAPGCRAGIEPRAARCMAARAARHRRSDRGRYACVRRVATAAGARPTGSAPSHSPTCWWKASPTISAPLRWLRGFGLTSSMGPGREESIHPADDLRRLAGC